MRNCAALMFSDVELLLLLASWQTQLAAGRLANPQQEELLQAPTQQTSCITHPRQAWMHAHISCSTMHGTAAQ
jgi:hypothetical protein